MRIIFFAFKNRQAAFIKIVSENEKYLKDDVEFKYNWQKKKVSW